MRAHLLGIAVFSLVVSGPQAFGQPCPGDINADGQVTVDEILKVVNVALDGCPSAPSPTSTATLLPTETSVPTATPTPTLTLLPSTSPTATLSPTPSRYVMNLVNGGDWNGTITDTETGLMWEMKSVDADPLHSVLYDKSVFERPRPLYLWEEKSVHVEALNNANFAGYSDWRLPAPYELVGLVDYSRHKPAIDPIFQQNCFRLCAIGECSCTAAPGIRDQLGPASYWSASIAPNGQSPVVNFFDGSFGSVAISGEAFVRGVREATPQPTPLPPQERFVDQGNETIFDRTTGLTWEKKSKEGASSGHDVISEYSFDDAVSRFVAGLNAGSGFAGHTDWRIPTITELLTLVDYSLTTDLLIYEAFSQPCGDCRLQACSCASNEVHWTSSPYGLQAGDMWTVQFRNGVVTHYPATPPGILAAVRAVRGP